ncbi:MAG: hypothetical protein JW797_06760 [Bradymonadales bacterium]|nr:hypothetical protein [Bradymonadales bacterium]
MKKQVPLIITFLVGMAMVVFRFIPHSPFNRLDTELSVFFDILANFAIILGAANLCYIHILKISKRRKGWGFSLVTVVGFTAMVVVGLFKLPLGLRSGAELEDARLFYNMGYDYLFQPLSSTMFSLLAFFVASASYRAFRAKNREATMLLLSAFFILLGRTLLGTALTQILPGILEFFFAAIAFYLCYEQVKAKHLIAAGVLGLVGAFIVGIAIRGYVLEDAGHLTIPALLNWIMVYPQLAGQRALMIGICLGVISMSLRIILGLERSYLGTEE